ncbi:MAG: SdrD B-like domain-containing protein [Clostridium sp.]|uniref:SdrD B-like domain-containing protein n=1 Tax=Anaerorhabdus sp. TaxID=1872524 RepID=UPI002FC956A5
MPLINVYNAIQKGAVTITGNTLGLGKGGGLNPGFGGSIGGFVTTDVTLPTPTAWVGIENLANNENITLNWMENSSTAYLNLPIGSEVLHARLIWGGSIISFLVDETANIDSPVNLTTSIGTFSIIPDISTSQTFILVPAGQSNSQIGYTRSADVTAMVSSGGSGAYTVGGVPSAISPSNPAFNAAGWTLIVAYKNNSFPINRLDIYAGGVSIAGTLPAAYTGISGFATPSSGPISARILVSAIDGDCNTLGDSISLGPTTSNLTKLYGPNNKANPPNTVDNFFASQINIGDPTKPTLGQLDTSGTYGNRNQNLATNTNTFAGRQGWDITNVDGSAMMQNSQTSAVIKLATNSDGYIVSGLATQILTESPIINVVKNVDLTTVAQGDKITYTLEITNSGTWPTKFSNVIDYMPTGAKLDINSVQTFSATGPVINNSDINTLNIDVGPINIGQKVIIKYDVYTDENTVTPINNDARTSYCYEPVVNTTYCNEENSNTVSTIILPLSITGTVWYDANCNGIREITEALASGIVVELYKSPNLTIPIKFTTTDINGFYKFTGLSKGDYYVKVILPPGYRYTLVNVGSNSTIDSDINPSSGLSYKVTLSIINKTAVIDAGLCIPKLISGQAFFDCNNNGILDDNESLICDVQVSLIDENGIPIETTTTNCDGYYEFTNLPSGNYTVKVTAPTDMTHVVPVPTNYYGSKPDPILETFMIILTNQDYTQGFAGFTGPLKLKLQYCQLYQPCNLCNYDDADNQGQCETCKTNDNTCLGCQSCRSNRNITTTRTSCSKCKCNSSNNSNKCSKCNSCN